MHKISIIIPTLWFIKHLSFVIFKDTGTFIFYSNEFLIQDVDTLVHNNMQVIVEFKEQNQKHRIFFKYLEDKKYDIRIKCIFTVRVNDRNMILEYYICVIFRFDFCPLVSLSHTATLHSFLFILFLFGLSSIDRCLFQS